MKDLRTFFEEYSRLFPEEIVSVDRAVDAKWHASAVATKAERACKTAPVLIFNQVRLLNGKTSAYPAVVNLLSSRRRLSPRRRSPWFGARPRNCPVPVRTALRKAPARNLPDPAWRLV